MQVKLHWLRGLVAERLGVPTEEVAIDWDLLEDLGLDPLDIVELVMAIERTFSIQIPDAHIRDFRTVRGVAQYLAVEPALAA